MSVSTTAPNVAHQMPARQTKKARPWPPVDRAARDEHGGVCLASCCVMFSGEQTQNKRRNKSRFLSNHQSIHRPIRHPSALSGSPSTRVVHASVLVLPSRLGLCGWLLDGRSRRGCCSVEGCGLRLETRICFFFFCVCVSANERVRPEMPRRGLAEGAVGLP